LIINYGELGWYKRDTRPGTTESFTKKAIARHGNRYDYSTVVYKTNKIKVDIGCKRHGVFSQTPTNHLGGANCPACAREERLLWNDDDTQRFITQAQRLHGERYDYSQVTYRGLKTKITILCREHGPFEQTPDTHLRGCGCTICGYLSLSTARRGNIDYSKTDYTRSNDKVTITCRIHGDFYQIPPDHMDGHGCPQCRPHCSISTGEIELFDFLAGLTPTVQSDRTVIAPYEIDCFMPKQAIGVEYCGLYYHSEKFKDSRYHLDKLTKAKVNNIDLIQIFDDEWLEKPAIVKSILAIKLGKIAHKLHGRKTQVKEVDSAEAKTFLQDNHIQGFAHAPIRIGLYHEQQLVMLATFSPNRAAVSQLDEGWYELVRLCTQQHTVVRGGFSKLLKHFIQQYHPEGIKTYCDKRYFTGQGYEAVGFTKSHDTLPQYYYTKSSKRFSRYLFQKHKLAGQLKSYDATLSERENMQANHYHRIYDCGLSVFKLTQKKAP
jgi:hypothetical protein